MKSDLTWAPDDNFLGLMSILFIYLMFTSIKHVKINHQGQQHATNR